MRNKVVEIEAGMNTKGRLAKVPCLDSVFAVRQSEWRMACAERTLEGTNNAWRCWFRTCLT